MKVFHSYRSIYGGVPWLPINVCRCSTATNQCSMEAFHSYQSMCGGVPRHQSMQYGGVSQLPINVWRCSTATNQCSMEAYHSYQSMCRGVNVVTIVIRIYVYIETKKEPQTLNFNKLLSNSSSLITSYKEVIFMKSFS